MRTFVWINNYGQFLYVSESHTHTGRHVRASFTDDINLAYVAVRLPKFTDNTNPDLLTPVAAYSVRKVFIGVPK